MTIDARLFSAAAPYRRDKLGLTDAPVKPSATASSSKDRLIASRQRLRARLMFNAHPPSKRPYFSRPGSLEHRVKRVLLDIPGVNLVANALKGWWTDHPARQAGLVAGKSSTTLVQPVAREYPRATLVLAGSLGAAFVLLRPWRWLLRPKFLLMAATQIGTFALRNLEGHRG